MSEAKKPRAVVLGSVHMDLIARAVRLPGPGESVAGGSFSMSPGGKGGNQACQLALAGCDTQIITRLGRDVFGEKLIAALKAKGVDTSLIVIDDEAPTGASTVLAAEGDYSSIIASGAATNLSEADVEAARPAIEAADALVLQLELPVAISAHAAKFAWERGKLVVLNASPAPKNLDELPMELRRSITMLVVNRVEAGRLLGLDLRPGGETDAARELAKLGIETVVVTAGPNGSIAVHKGEAFQQPAFQAAVIDTVGAGDAFLGTLIAGMLHAQPFPQSLRRAAAAGAIAVARRGACEALPSVAEVDLFLTQA